VEGKVNYKIFKGDIILLFLSYLFFLNSQAFARRVKVVNDYPRLNKRNLELRAFDNLKLQGKDGNIYTVQIAPHRFLGFSEWNVRFALSDSQESALEQGYSSETNDFKFQGGLIRMKIDKYSIQILDAEVFPQGNKLYKQFIELLGEVSPQNAMIWSQVLEKTTLSVLEDIIEREKKGEISHSEALELVSNTPIGHIREEAGFTEHTWSKSWDIAGNIIYYLYSRRRAAGDNFNSHSLFVREHSIKVDNRSANELMRDLQNEEIRVETFREIIKRLLGIRGETKQAELEDKIGEIADIADDFIQVENVDKTHLQLSISDFPCQNIFLDLEGFIFTSTLSETSAGKSQNIIFANQLIGAISKNRSASLVKRLFLSLPKVKERIEELNR
jgi:hypothetical protein